MSFDLPLTGPVPIKKLSQVLEELAQGSEARVSLGDLIGALSEQSFVPLMILFSLPNVFFFVPGSSVITGLPLIFIALQMLMGRPPLVSYGGTAMLVLMMAFGLVQSANVHRPR